MDIYERKYDSLLTLVSRLFSFYSLIMLVFTILINIFVYPNDSIRIYEALEKEKTAFTEPKNIFESFKEKKSIKDLNEFKKRLKRNCCQKLIDKFAFIFCYCCNKNPRTEHLYIIKNYIDKNLSIESQLVNSVKDDKKKEGQLRNRFAQYKSEEFQNQNKSIELSKNNNNINDTIYSEKLIY